MWTWSNRQDSVAIAAVGQPTDATHISSLIFSLSNGSIVDHGRHQGDKAGGRATTYTGAPLMAVAQPPPASTFLTRHSWSFDALPTWESERVLDVSAVYGELQHKYQFSWECPIENGEIVENCP